MISSERSSSDLSEYTLIQIEFIIYKNQFLDEKFIVFYFFLQFYFLMPSKVKRFYKFCILYRKNHIKMYQNITSFYLVYFYLIKKGMISSKTSYISSCSDFRFKNMNHLHCNVCMYVSFYAANMFTELIFLIRNEDVIEILIKEINVFINELTINPTSFRKQHVIF